jgi:hypothetical protein
MTNKKTAFQFILGGMMLISAASIGCNDTSTKSETTTEPAVEKMKEEPAAAPVLPDSTSGLTPDSLSKRPIIKTP